MPNSNEKGEFMQKKIPIEKTKRQSKPKVYKDPMKSLKKDFSYPEAIEELKQKMLDLVNEGKVTLMTQVALKLGFTPDTLYQVVENHPELKETFDQCKLQVGLNAYNNIENRTNVGMYSRFSVTRFLKEVRDDRDEERAFELAKIAARKEAQKEQYEKLITEFREQDGKRIAVVSVDENIIIPEE